MSEKRRKWTLAISALLTAAAAVPVSAEDFNDFYGKMPSNRPQDPSVSQPAAGSASQAQPVAPTAYILPSTPLPATQPADTGRTVTPVYIPPSSPSDLQPASAPVARTSLNLAVAPETASDCKTCAPRPAVNASTTASYGAPNRDARRETRHECCQDHFLGYPAEFQSPPLGHAVYEVNAVMVANADAARMVLYHYDFLDGANLNYRGKDQLAKIIELLTCSTAPIVVERIVENPRLAEARRQVVLNDLRAAGIPIPDERVIVGVPSAIGLKGGEAILIQTNLIQQTLNQGRNAATAASSLSSSSGGSSGSSGGGGSLSSGSGVIQP